MDGIESYSPPGFTGTTLTTLIITCVRHEVNCHYVLSLTLWFEYGPKCLTSCYCKLNTCIHIILLHISGVTEFGRGSQEMATKYKERSGFLLEGKYT